MNELFRKDITIRILSVLFAVVLWFFVLDSDNPINTVLIPVQLKVINEDMLQDKGIFLKNKDFKRSIEVFIKGRKDKVKSVSLNDFEAVLDFSKVKSADDTQLTIDGPKYIGKEDSKDIQIWDVRPKFIKLEMERIEKNPFKVEVIPTGKLKENYRMMKVTATPDIIPLQGLDSQIKAVDTIKAFIDVTNLDRDIVINKKECKVYNKNGEEIKELGQNLFVDVKVEVAKEVSLVPAVKGEPAKNFLNKEMKIKPDKVLITGSPEVLSKITELRTEPVDLTNVTANVDVSRRIALPQGIKLASGVKEEAQVNVAIEELIVKEFTVSKEDINIIINTGTDNSFKYEIVEDQVKIEIRSSREELEKLNVDALKPVIDVSTLGEGTHKVQLKIALPSNAKLVEDINVEVKIVKK